MRHSLYEADHDDFRASVRTFVEKEIAPFHDQWERDSIVPREVWEKAGALGLLGFAVPEEYGGGGVDDFRFNVVLNEELTRVGGSGVSNIANAGLRRTTHVGSEAISGALDGLTGAAVESGINGTPFQPLSGMVGGALLGAGMSGVDEVTSTLLPPAADDGEEPPAPGVGASGPRTSTPALTTLPSARNRAPRGRSRSRAVTASASAVCISRS